ncbi:MAG: 1-acyl-sn-glycerol-3-phosphate acyltransferase [Verrucomicrobia bacterium]|nr:1-acyl-sn-glycerol-3-phosphate acyltransferase [Verrucomicrobiota bacterium]
MAVLFRCATRTEVVFLTSLPAGGYIVAANHISHFDPVIISCRFPRYIDWIAMDALFRGPAATRLFDWLRAIPVSRDGSDRSALRVAHTRLAKNRVVGIFPEAGIRAGPGSVLEGAPMWPGVAALSVLAGKPVVPCVILGSDRLYRPRAWLERPPVWLAFGQPVWPAHAVDRRTARNSVQEGLARAFLDLKEHLLLTYHLQPGDLPTTPQARKGEGRNASSRVPAP